jgi:hypothetical protein
MILFPLAAILSLNKSVSLGTISKLSQLVIASRVKRRVDIEKICFEVFFMLISMK